MVIPVKEISIAGRKVGPGHPCFIIAEAGVNHNGKFELAKQMVDVALESGADAIKFQTGKAERVVSVSAPKADYQLQTTDVAESQLDMIKALELSYPMYAELQEYCNEVGLMFMSTAFDTESADFLAGLDMPVFKIPSGEVNNLPFLKHIGSKGKPVILSTGMSYLDEVGVGIRVLREAGCEELVVLHCATNYPVVAADANIRAMQTMATAFGVPVGYSDHTMGIEVSLTATALGACAIEKHFSLDPTMAGPDHLASLDPSQLKAMVKGIRIVEEALGHGLKEPADSEANTRLVVRRSLAAMVDLNEGQVLTEDVLTQLRPGTGIPPTLTEQVVGRTMNRSLRSGELLDWSHLA